MVNNVKRKDNIIKYIKVIIDNLNGVLECFFFYIIWKVIILEGASYLIYFFNNSLNHFILLLKNNININDVKITNKKYISK